jgi:N-acetylneuraminate synthase|tara:strand:- start:534 stop:746 length:213 start_codon:yes stop_codon:yes gene_type:complete
MPGNYNQSLEKAMKIAEAAYKARVHTLKLQTYTADTITINERYGNFAINHSKSLWDGKTLHEQYEQAYTP